MRRRKRRRRKMRRRRMRRRKRRRTSPEGAVPAEQTFIRRKYCAQAHGGLCRTIDASVYKSVRKCADLFLRFLKDTKPERQLLRLQVTSDDGI
eukprot:3625300-Pyramimonas_sp.AAC.1